EELASGDGPRAAEEGQGGGVVSSSHVITSRPSCRAGCRGAGECGGSITLWLRAGQLVSFEAPFSAFAVAFSSFLCAFFSLRVSLVCSSAFGRWPVDCR